MTSYWYYDKPTEITLNHVGLNLMGVSAYFHNCRNRAQQQSLLGNLDIFVLNSNQQVLFRVGAGACLESLNAFMDSHSFYGYLSKGSQSVDFLLNRSQVKAFVEALDKFEPLEPNTFKDFLNRFGTPSFGKKRRTETSLSSFTPAYQRQSSSNKDTHSLRTPDFYRNAKP